MASDQSTSFATTAGLSCGVCLAIPVVAFAVTLPFDAAHAIVNSCALPFAAGALASVGVSGVSARIADSWDARHHDAPKDVPIISRASGAPSDREAWAELDALLSEDSPISCDPRTAKDVYQIALEELQQHTAAPAADKSRPSTEGSVSDEETAPDGGSEHDAAPDDGDRAAARLAALASLDLVDEASAPSAARTDSYETWAAALAILDEPDAVEDDAALETAHVAYVGKHFASSAVSSTKPTPVPPSPERAAAVAEGARATERHSHVNALIEEAFEQVPSTSVRNTSREYLSVIEGGTISMPPLKAEA